MSKLPNWTLNCNQFKFLFYAWLCLVFSIRVQAQSKDPFCLSTLLSEEYPCKKSLFSGESWEGNQVRSGEDDCRIFNIVPGAVKSIQSEFHSLLSIEIPVSEKDNREFIYTEYNFFTSDFEVNLISEINTESVTVDRGIHLKGKVADDENSFSSISLFQGEVYGTVYTGDGIHLSILPGETGNPENKICKFVEESNNVKATIAAGCHTDDILHYMGPEKNMEYRTGDNCKSVVVSVNIDYILYMKFEKNVQAITNYVTGLFNNVHTLYKRENISIALAQINIHTAPDNFTHITASEDLEYFRKKYPNTNKTIKLLLSGYNKSNQPTLGGISYINTICLPTYSYGFANVIGIYSKTPVYSWDVFLVTHELGHILGSRHTHACVWGPSKNKAIDNCAKLEGSCASPGLPMKGTLMSYCYLNGMPGIDLTLGFGTEPGNLIRQRIKSSACLSSYVPLNKTLNKASSVIEANLECTDGSYTHYYFDNNTMDPNDDILLISIAKNGNDIGKLGDGKLSIKLITTKKYNTKRANSITASYVEKNRSWFVASKYWEIKPAKNPVTPVDIRYYFHTTDYDDLKGSTGSILPSDLKLFHIQPPGNPNPESNHANTSSLQIKLFSSATKRTNNAFVVSKPEANLYTMDLNSQSLTSTGFGAYVKTQSLMVWNPLISDGENSALLQDKTTDDFGNQKSNLVVKEHSGTIHGEFILNEKNVSNVEVSILDVSGRILYAQLIQLDVDKNKFEINSQELSNGMYYLLVKSSSEVLKTGFIINR